MASGHSWVTLCLQQSQGLSPQRATVQEAGGRASLLRSLLANPKGSNAVVATWGITPQEAVVTKDPSWPMVAQAQAQARQCGRADLTVSPTAFLEPCTGLPRLPDLQVGQAGPTVPSPHRSPTTALPWFPPRDKGALHEGLLFQGLPRWGRRALGAAGGHKLLEASRGGQCRGSAQTPGDPAHAFIPGQPYEELTWARTLAPLVPVASGGAGPGAGGSRVS